MYRWYPALLVGLAALASLAAYRALPPSMVVHWDLRGRPNGWLPRPAATAFMPLLIGVVWAVLHAAPRMASGNRTPPAMRDGIGVGALALLFVTHLLVLAVNLGARVPMERAPMLLVGALFIVIGRAIPLAGTGSALGVRTPWALSSERVWQRTHLLAGQALTGCGAVTIVAALVLPVDLAMAVMVATIVAGVVAPMAYSWLTWKRESRK